jgi:hypothetical protein
MKRKRTKLTREFWERDAREKRELEERVAQLKRQIAGRRAAEEQR